MLNSVISHLSGQPTMKILRGLLTSPRPRHLRDLAAQYELSPSGVSDIIRRLQQSGVLKEVREKNRRCFRLSITAQEFECLKVFFAIHEINLVRQRAPHYSKHAASRLAGMDELYSFYKKAKEK